MKFNMDFNELFQLVENDTLSAQEALISYSKLASISVEVDRLNSVNNLFIQKLRHELPWFREAALIALDVLWTQAIKLGLIARFVEQFVHTKQEVVQFVVSEKNHSLQWIAIELLQENSTFYSDYSLE
jgi:hypothetical protein